MANPIAVPGTNVPSGAAVSPGGAQGVTGLAGTPAWTTCTSSFTVPAVGSTVSVPVVDTSWVTTGEMIYVDQAGGTGQSGVLQVTAKTSNSLTLLNPTPAPAIPPADVTQAGLLKQLSGNTTDFVDGTNTCQNLVTAVQPTIWSMRLRSFNAIGNSTFEVDQRNVGGSVTNPSGGQFILDRWSMAKSGTMAANWQQNYVGVVVPNTNFFITRSFLRCTLTTQEVSLAAGDLYGLAQIIEGSQWRELCNDVTSLSLLVRSSVAGLKFGASIRDPAGSQSLTKLCTIPSANTWTYVTLPNLPQGGAYATLPGSQGLLLNITLASGTTYMSPANDTWQSGGAFVGAPGQSNFAASPLNSTLDLAFVQHEPGALCTTPIDCQFSQNLDECLRYYQKSWNYGVAVGTVTNTGGVNGTTGAAAYVTSLPSFLKPMAKTPTVVIYDNVNGAINTMYNNTAGTHVAVSSVANGEKGLTYISLTTAQTVGQWLSGHYTADTGW